MIIIPAVDIRGGKCVQLRQGLPEEETVFSDDPVAMARRWADGGAEYLHVVDLDGTFAGESRNLDLVGRIVKKVACPVELGGGLRTDDAVEAALATGIDRAIVGTRAVTDSDWLARLVERFPGRIVVSVDARDGIVSLKGWTESSSVSAVDLVDDLNALQLAALVYTDISHDGELAGPNVEATAEVVRRSRHPVIASGGVSTVENIKALVDIKTSGAIIEHALYEGTITLAAALEAARS